LAERALRALVLSGGGAKGAYEVGVVTTLVEEFGETFDIVCGTSIGAMNAGMIAKGATATEELKQLWLSDAVAKTIKPAAHAEPFFRSWELWKAATEAPLPSSVGHWLRLAGHAIANVRKLLSLHTLAGLTGVLDEAGVRDLLASKLSYDELECVLLTSACNLSARREDTFYYFPPAYAEFERPFLAVQHGDHRMPIPFDRETFAEFVRASGAVPCAFSPVSLVHTGDLEHAYVDGAVTNNTPISQAIDAGARDVTIVYVDPPSFPEHHYPHGTIPEIMVSCLSVMRQRMLDLDYQTALRVNDARKAGAPNATDKHHVKLRKFRPNTVLAASVVDFKNGPALTADFETGRADARSSKRHDYAEHSHTRPKPAASEAVDGSNREG
jgi:predicted acylesterase/phospholipase RssA